jgi:hypothetical protein
MIKLIAGIENRYLLLAARSASHSFACAALQQWHQERYVKWVDSGSLEHPARYLPNIIWPHDCESPAIIVRNPVERFRSMVAHKSERTISEHLDAPVYGPLRSGSWSRCFRFEDQLQECADWLGITIHMPHLDMTSESDKPMLTTEQEHVVRGIYAADIALWESIQ